MEDKEYKELHPGYTYLRMYILTGFSHGSFDYTDIHSSH